MTPARLRIGVLTSHTAVGPDEEFAAMAPGHVVTRVARVTGKASGATNDAPTTPDTLRALTAPAVLEHAAQTLFQEAVDAVAYASTTSAYVIGFDAETAMISRLASSLDVPVVSTCASAELALRVLDTERLALVGAPWFDPELNDLGAAYFRTQGFDVVSSQSADLSRGSCPGARRRRGMDGAACRRRGGSDLYRGKRVGCQNSDSPREYLVLQAELSLGVARELFTVPITTTVCQRPVREESCL